MEFDPYSEWLGIESMPCSDLELLGLATSDSFDRDAISEAYQARYTIVRQYQVGQLAETATRVLNELSIAYHRLTIGSTERALLRSVGQGSSPAISDKTSASSRENVPVRELEPEEQHEPTAESPPARFRKGSRKRSRRWYIQTADGERMGPLTRARVRKHLRRGIVSGDALVWKRGWTVSLPAHAVFPEYFATTETAPMEQADIGTFNAADVLQFEPVLVQDNHAGSPKMAPPLPWTQPNRSNTALIYVWIAVSAITVSVVLAVGSLVMSWRVDARLQKLDAQTSSTTTSKPEIADESDKVQKANSSARVEPKQNTALREQINEEIEEVYDPVELKALLEYLRRQRAQRD